MVRREYDSSILPRVEEFIRKHDLISAGDGILLAVSGGQDSVAMLDILCSLSEKFKANLSVGHVNHSLRGEESDADEKFVLSLAESYGLPFFSERVNVREFAQKQRCSLEDAARRLRYDALERMRTQASCQLIATGHTADDNAETVLFNLVRGTGIRGFSGIPVRRGKIIRPLLCLTREEIDSYIINEKLPFREDSSNVSANFTRNFLRKEIIPRLRERINPQLAHQLRQTSEIFWDLVEFLDKYIEEKLASCARREGETIILEISYIKSYLVFVQREIIAHIARDWLHEPLSFQQVEGIRRLFEATNGAFVQLPHGLRVWKEGEVLVFEREHLEPLTSQTIELNREYEFPGFKFSSEVCELVNVSFDADPYVEFVDAEQLRPPLVLRPWLPEDGFYPLGLGAEKSVGEFLADAKVPRRLRHLVPVLESAGRIVWVCGYRIDERFAVTAQSTRVVKLSMKILSQGSEDKDR